ncbi:MAG: hypothetical protein O3C63_01900 [Cyanobacteria bacterium]|nr:hypothetical protein [Cyanobacteriota bacterium]
MSNLTIINRGAVRNIQEVKKVLDDRETLAETGQVGGTNVRAAIATVPKGLSNPSIDHIRVDTFVLEGKDAYEESGYTALRKDLALLRDISALTVEKAHQCARNLKMLFGFSGAPVTNHEFMTRNLVASFIENEDRGLFFIPNVKAFSNDGKNAYLLDLPNMMNGALPQVQSRYKFENNQGQERKEWYSPEAIQARNDKTASIKVVNDAVAHVRFQADNYSQGASLLHLVMSTGANTAVGYKKQDDELGNFQKSFNMESGHVPFSELFEDASKSPLMIRQDCFEDATFEKVMAGGNSNNPRTGLAGLVRDLREQHGLISEFVEKANYGYALLIESALGDNNNISVDEILKSSLFIDKDVTQDLNQAIEEAAINGDKFAKVLTAIWASDLAKAVNGIAASAKVSLAADHDVKFNFSMNGSVAYGLLDNDSSELDYLKEIFAKGLDAECFIKENDITMLNASRPAAEMDGLVEQAYKFAVAAVQAA